MKLYKGRLTFEWSQFKILWVYRFNFTLEPQWGLQGLVARESGEVKYDYSGTPDPVQTGILGYVSETPGTWQLAGMFLESGKLKPGFVEAL